MRLYSYTVEKDFVDKVQHPDYPDGKLSDAYRWIVIENVVAEYEEVARAFVLKRYAHDNPKIMGNASFMDVHAIIDIRGR
jgi:hypothetical protein